MAIKIYETDTAKELFSNAILGLEKPKIKYFKVSDATEDINTNWTDIPNPILTKDITDIIKIDKKSFSIEMEITNKEIGKKPVSIVGIYDDKDRLLYIAKIEPPTPVHDYLVLEVRITTCVNTEDVLDLELVPWNEYEQTLSIIDILNHLNELEDDLSKLKLTVNSNDLVKKEIEKHNNDELAHPTILKALADLGYIVENRQFKYVGQNYDKDPVFDPSVNEDDLVYKDADGKYKPAIADGTNKSNVIGIAKVSQNKVITSGFIQVENQTELANAKPGQKLYLSTTKAGKITLNLTTKEIGFFIRDNIILLGNSVGGSGGISNINEIIDIVEYYIAWNTSPYELIYFNTFKQKSDTKIFTSGNYTYKNGKLNIKANTELITKDVINSNQTLYRFHLIVKDYPTDSIKAFYSTDNGNTWNKANINSTTIVENGFKTLRFKFKAEQDSILDSFGVLYKYNVNKFKTVIRLLETLEIDNDLDAGTIITLPNEATYTNDGKSLEVYLNRVRLYPNIDYQEIDNRSIKVLLPLHKGDKLLFTESFGYIDSSIDNKRRLDLEHDEKGHHVFTDLTTGKKYRLAIDNGKIVLIPV